MGNCHTVGPNEALIVSGHCCGKDHKQYVIGGWAWAWLFVSEVQRISLEVITLNPKCEGVETALGVRLTVTGVAQVKVMASQELLMSACEQFIGKSTKQIQQALLQTLEGHLRAILGTLTVEEIYRDRDRFACMVREVASPDVARMGIEIISFVIKEVSDAVDYLNSIGRAQTALVKRDAAIGVAEADRDAGIQEAECEKEKMDVVYDCHTKVADSERFCDMAKAIFNKEVNAAKADARLAYRLQAAKENQAIRSEEIQIKVVERHMEIAIEEKEIERKEHELEATVRRPAEAEAFKVETLAQGRKTKTVEIAKATADHIKRVGVAEANFVEAVGKAEAEGMRLKAGAFKLYGDAAMMSLILDSLPKIAAEVASPLSRVNDIVLLGGEGDRVTNDIVKLMTELPPAVEAVTGVDLSKMLKELPGAKMVI